MKYIFCTNTFYTILKIINQYVCYYIIPKHVAHKKPNKMAGILLKIPMTRSSSAIINIEIMNLEVISQS